jgi:hypothetical protein
MPSPDATATPRYPMAELNDLPDDIRTAVLAVQEKAGFVPNVFLAATSLVAAGNGSAVSAWGGFTQATAAQKPTLYTTGGGSSGTLPYVAFTTTNILVRDSLSLAQGTNGGRTLIMYMQFASVGSTQRVIQIQGPGTYVTWDCTSNGGFSTGGTTSPNYAWVGNTNGSACTVAGVWAVFVARETNSTLKNELFRFTGATTTSTIATSGKYFSTSMGNALTNGDFNENFINGYGRYNGGGNIRVANYEVYDSPLPDASIAIIVNSMISGRSAY